MNAEFDNNYGSTFLKLSYEQRHRREPRTKEINLGNVLKHVEYLGEDIVVYYSNTGFSQTALKVVRSDTWTEEEVDLETGLRDVFYMMRYDQLQLMNKKAEELVESAKEDIRRSKVESMARSCEDESQENGEGGAE